jgi:ABC-type transporter Mla maintaining outer membrane lipid asymmetry ATPase subunit MlaF
MTLANKTKKTNKKTNKKANKKLTMLGYAEVARYAMPKAMPGGLYLPHSNLPTNIFIYSDS